MPITYKVKPGETLYGIAQKHLGSGSKWKQLGYKGDPRKMSVGTVLTIPTEAPVERATEIRSQLTGGTKVAPAPTPAADTGGDYSMSKIKTDLSFAGTEKKKAYDELIGLQSNLYEKEYNQAGLKEAKIKIAGVDTDISNRKAQRDQMLLDEMGKPISQWMITGRKKLEVDEAAKDINRLIDQRNSMASGYNTSIQNVIRKVGYGLQDATTKYSHWEGEEKRLSGLSETYQGMMAAELAGQKEEEQWERDFALRQKQWGKEYDLSQYEAETSRISATRPKGGGGGGSTKSTKYTFKEYEVGGQKIRDTIDPYTGKVVNREVLGKVKSTPTVSETIKTYADAGYTRGDIEKMYKEEKKAVPQAAKSALDQQFGQKNKWWWPEGTWGKAPW